MNINFYDGNCSPCNKIWKPVDTLPELEKATRNHAYILPDNTVWVLNHEGTEFIKADGTEADPLNILNTDGNLTIEKNGAEVTINISDKLNINGDTNLPEIEKNQFLGNLGNGLEPVTEATHDIIEAGASEVATIISPKELREAIVNIINNTESADAVYDDTEIKEKLEYLESETTKSLGNIEEFGRRVSTLENKDDLKGIERIYVEELPQYSYREFDRAVTEFYQHLWAVNFRQMSAGKSYFEGSVKRVPMLSQDGGTINFNLLRYPDTPRIVAYDDYNYGGGNSLHYTYDYWKNNFTIFSISSRSRETSIAMIVPNYAPYVYYDGALAKGYTILKELETHKLVKVSAKLAGTIVFELKAQ